MLKEIIASRRASATILWIFDYDGTLTPIVSKPEQAQISPERLEIVRRLIETPRTRFAIVSGRSVGTLLDFLKPLHDYYFWLCGLHGGEVCEMPSLKFLLRPDSNYSELLLPIKRAMYRLLESPGFEGVMLEDKLHSMALHYRLATPDVADKAVFAFRQVLMENPQVSQYFRFQTGKKVLEVLPKTFNKGAAIQFIYRYFVEITGKQLYWPIYVGDDLTDEDAFEVINAYRGLSIRIGSSDEIRTRAQFTLPNVDALYRELETSLSISARA